MADIFQVGKSKAVLIGASAASQRKIINAGPGKIYYKNAADVDTGDTEVAVDASFVTSQTVWIISESESKVFQEPVSGVQPVSALPGVWAGGVSPLAKTSGTDVAFAEKKLFVSSVFVPVNKTITGVGVLLGTEGGTNKLVAGLFNSAGEVVAKTSETTEGTVAGTKETIQEIAFTSTYNAIGPALFYIGITGNGNTAKLRTINIGGKNIFAKELELATKNVLANITAPTTFTADKGPVAFIY